MRATLALATVGLIGCVDFPATPADTCGNQIVELAEDCDDPYAVDCGAPSSAHPCAYICEVDGLCPVGYFCGQDLRCRAATEAFASAAPQPMSAAYTSARDVDGDGAADLTGYDINGLVTRFGDPRGSLIREARLAMPGTGRYSSVLADDFGGAPRLVAPLGTLGLGLFLGDGTGGFTVAAQTLDDVPPPGPQQPGCPAALYAGLPPGPAAAPRRLRVVPGDGVAFVDGPACGTAAACALPDADPKFGDGALLRSGVALAALGYGVDDGVQPDAQFTVGVAGARAVVLWGATLADHAVTPLATWTLPFPLDSEGWVGFANLDTDGCPDLAIDMGGALAVAWSRTSGSECVGLAPTLSIIDDTGDHWGYQTFAAADLDGDGRDELVYRGDGVVGAYDPVAAAGERARPLLVTAATPDVVTALDYNHDGARDLVLASPGVLTYYLNADHRGFNPFAVPVPGTPRALAVGDYDGDLYDDLAVAVATEGAAEASTDDIYVVYGGAAGQPGAAVRVTTVAAAATVTRSPGATLDDLLVTSNSNRGGCVRGLAVLLGATSRQLVSPLAIAAPDDDGALAMSAAVGVTTPFGLPRVLAFGQTTDARDAVAVVEVTERFLGPHPAIVLPLPPEQPPHQWANAAWAVGDLDDDPASNPEVVAAVDNTAMVFRVNDDDPAAGGRVSVVSTPLPAVLNTFDEVFASPLTLVDLDADGDRDALMLAFGAGEAGDLASAWAWIHNDGGVLAFDAPTLLPLPADLDCFDVDVIYSSLDGQPQLLALCLAADEETPVLDRLIFATLSPTSPPQAIFVRELRLATPAYQLEVADFTGDGLEDIATFDEQRATILWQCASDDLGISSVYCEAPSVR